MSWGVLSPFLGVIIQLTTRISNSSSVLVRHKNRVYNGSREPSELSKIRWCQNDNKILSMKKNLETKTKKVSTKTKSQQKKIIVLLNQNDDHGIFKPWSRFVDMEEVSYRRHNCFWPAWLSYGHREWLWPLLEGDNRLWRSWWFTRYLSPGDLAIISTILL